MKKILLTIVLGFLSVSLFAQKQYEVLYKDLPKDVQKYVTKNYDGYNIDKAVLGESKKGKMTFCDVYISKDAEKSKLIFDSDGEFVKKVTVVPTAAVAPAPAPAPPPAPAQVAPEPTPPPVPDTTGTPK